MDLHIIPAPSAIHYPRPKTRKPVSQASSTSSELKDRSKAAQKRLQSLSESGYSHPFLGEFFGTTELAISRIVSGATPKVPAYLINRILETDLSTMPSPQPSRRLKTSLKASLRPVPRTTPKSDIRIPRKPIPELPKYDRDPRHHAKYWYDMGFSVVNIAKLARISAGDVERALNGYTVGNYSSKQLVDSFSIFESHLID